MAREHDLAHLLLRVEGILERVEGLLPPPPSPTDWSAHAFAGASARAADFSKLSSIRIPIRLGDLVAIDEQKRAIDANTRQFVAACRPTMCC
jgi:predicted AAA+ superfamily ATPase